MSISRKEFLTRGLAAFGRDLVSAARGEENLPPAGAVAGCSAHLRVDNRRCLASRGGCFSCLDGCPHEAISITAGVGIVVDPGRCDGCGKCIQICPIEPKPIILISSEAVNIPTEKGE